jgi:hypothetical protein
LLEVVVAVSVFAIGMLAVVGLFTPVARSVTLSSDAEAAARVADALRVKLQAMPPASVLALLKNSTGTRHALTDADNRSDYNPAADAQILFANRDASKIGGYNDPIWLEPVTGRNSDAEKYFEIALIRNEALTPLPAAPSDDATPPPPNSDDTAFLIAYVARLRAPAFVRDGASGSIQVGSNPAGPVRFDHSAKQVFFFSGSITR